MHSEKQTRGFVFARREQVVATSEYKTDMIRPRSELSYLAPLGSENISAPYFKQCFFRGGVLPPPDRVKHHASQSQDRNKKYFILYIEFCINNKI